MKQHARAAILEEDTILMVRHRLGGRDYWTLPGGGVEPGETFEQAAVREVEEEVNLTVRVTRFLWERSGDDPKGGFHTKCFLADRIGPRAPVLGHDPELPPDGQMLAEFAWFKLSEAADDKMVALVIKELGPLGACPKGTCGGPAP